MGDFYGNINHESKNRPYPDSYENDRAEESNYHNRYTPLSGCKDVFIYNGDQININTAQNNVVESKYTIYNMERDWYNVEF